MKVFRPYLASNKSLSLVHSCKCLLTPVINSYNLCYFKDNFLTSQCGFILFFSMLWSPKKNMEQIEHTSESLGSAQK